LNDSSALDLSGTCWTVVRRSQWKKTACSCRKPSTMNRLISTDSWPTASSWRHMWGPS